MSPLRPAGLSGDGAPASRGNGEHERRGHDETDALEQTAHAKPPFFEVTRDGLR